MAGSYAMANDNLRYLENQGDSLEAIEEMLWLIHRTIGHNSALQLMRDEFYPMARGELPPDIHFARIRERMEREL